MNESHSRGTSVTHAYDGKYTCFVTDTFANSMTSLVNEIDAMVL